MEERMSGRNAMKAILPFLLILLVAGIGWSTARGKAPPAPTALADLGKRMFFDPSLSTDGRTSCATCHQPTHAFADDTSVPVGTMGRKGTRNAPSLAAIAPGSPLFWDGRRDSLDDATVDPLFHPQEMGLADEAALQVRLQAAGYRSAFANALGTATDVVPGRAQAALALAAYVRTLPRPETAFDRYTVRHDDAALSRIAKDGLRLFTGKAGCASCHRLEGTPAHFSDNDFHTTGTGLQKLGNQLSTLTADVAGQPTDPASIGRLVAVRSDLAATGRFVVTHKPSDIGLFRTPSLRYVAQTAPYMHDGSVATLEEAVDQEIYWRGLSSGHPLSLTVSERAALIAFLRSLSPPTTQAGTVP